MDKILQTSDKILVGDNYTGDLASFNGKIFVFDFDNQPDPLNPLHLPSNTVRVRTNDGNAPIIKTGSTQHATYDTAILVAGTNDVYDVYKSGTSFEGLLYYSINVVEVLGANTSGITNMVNMFKNCAGLTTVSIFDTSDVTTIRSMFHNCPSLTTVPLFNTYNVTDMGYMFEFDRALTEIPLFDTTNVTTMDYMCHFCSNVETGALALYQQASTQANIPTHQMTFYKCGSDTQTGAAELAQIPYEWK